MDDLFELSLQDVQSKESEDLFSNSGVNHADILFKFDTEDSEEYNSNANADKNETSNLNFLNYYYKHSLY